MSIYIPLWLLWLLLPVALLWLFVETWVYYLAVMHLKRVEQEQGLKPLARFMGYWIVLPFGLLRDWLLNMVLTVPALNLPAKLWELTTGRMQRYVSQQPNSLRGRMSWAFADDALNDFDRPYGHIKQNKE